MSIHKLMSIITVGLAITSCSGSQQAFYKQESVEAVKVSDLQDHPNADDILEAAKGCICHIPPGNPENAHTICIGAPAIPHHIAHHDDFVGPCDQEEEQPPAPPEEEQPPQIVPGPSPIEDPGPEVM